MHHPICTRHAVPASATTSLSTVLTDVQSSVVRCRTRSTGHVVKQHPPATSTHALRGQWAGTSVGRTLRSADVAHEHSVADRLCDQIVQSHDRILCKASASGYEQYRALRQAMEHTAHVLSDPRVNRATRDTARHALCAMVQSSPPDTLQFVARAFAEYQILIGEVEKFDGRRTRNEPLQTAQAIATLREHGLDLHNVLRSMRIAPVLTAHPTEIRTRDLIQVTHAFEQLLDSAAQPQVVLSGSGRQYTLPARSCVDVQALMTAVIEPLRAATLTFAEKSTVDQESIKTLSYFEDALFTSINQLCDAIDQAAGASLTTHGVHVDTWVGGDRDGNRLVTAESAAHAAARQAGVAVKHYQQALQDLAQQAPGLASACSLMSDRLAATHVELKRLAYLPEIPLMTSVDIYRNKAEVIAELQSLIDRLDGVEDQAARKAITRLQQAVHRYGFHLCSIDLRQSSHQHEVVVAELLSSHGMPGYKDLSEDQKCHVLATWISEPNARAMPPNFSDLAQYELSILQTAGRLQHVFGDDIIKNTIIAHTESPSDVLEVMALMHQTGLLRLSQAGDQAGFARLNIVPLVETVDDLMRAEAIFKALLDIPQYREQLKLRDDHLEVMLGYSDSNKGDGTLAARAILFDVTKKLAALEAKYPGLKLTFFHGTGGTPPRGGWTIAQTLEAQPEQSLRTGRIRKTIQGETIENDFGTSERALRSFDQLVSGVLKAAHPEIFPSPTAKQEHRLALDALAQHARRSYQSLLNMPDFEPSFFAMTAYAEVGSKLNLGSRKGARGAAQTIEDMRAIPWVFAWNQIELKLPTWYGVGSALRDFIRVDQPQQQAGFADDAHSEAVQPESAARIAKLETLREMYRDLPMFTHLLDNVALTLHSVDLDIARDYVAMIDDDLAASGKAIMKQITKEHNVLQAMLWLVGVDAIAGESAVPTPGRGHRHLPLLHILQQENVKTKGELESRRLHALAIATVHKQTA